MKVIETKNRYLLTRIYTTYIRPKLEYTTVIWNTHLKSQSAMIEKVQKAFSKRFKGLKNKSYQERLQILQLQSLEERRKINDAITVYKVLHHISYISLEDVHIKVSQSVTRGTKLLSKKTINNIVSRHFSVRVTNTWNSLPTAVRMTPTLSSIKSKLINLDNNR